MDSEGPIARWSFNVGTNTLRTLFNHNSSSHQSENRRIEFDHRQLIIWLICCSILVFSMIVLGGAVRLTGSGLSMVNWKPVLGVILPMNETEWIDMFDQYKKFPEYLLINKKINLDQFKFIFLMEYAHRMLGRLISFVFFVPFCFFLITGKLNSDLVLRLLVLLLLGVIQGGLGWYMVKSGLVGDPHVSQYRLTLHLFIGVVTYLYLLRLIFSSSKWSKFIVNPKLKNVGSVVICLLLIMVTTGGFVAGTRAGLMYNTYPKFGHNWIPDQLFSILPLWLNFFDNPVMVQFVHRWLAIVVLLWIIYYAILLCRSKTFKHSYLVSIFLCLLVFMQFFLGVFTLIYQVPLVLGMMHQVGALILLSVVLMSVSLMCTGSQNYVEHNL